jgi:hypothetical protein
MCVVGRFLDVQRVVRALLLKVEPLLKLICEMSGAERAKSIINNSPSKAQYAFPKASRFTSPKQHTSAFGYETRGYFSGNKAQGQGRGFGSSEDRFGYDQMRKKKRDAGKI